MDESEIQEKIKERYLRTKIIVEIAGFPKEHVEKTMNLLLEKISGDKALEVINHTIHPCKIVDEENKVWSTFLELEFLIDKFTNLLGVIFDYLPSSVEIIEPNKIAEDTGNINDLLNDLTAKLHEYNHAIKTYHAQNQILGRELMKFKEHIPKSGDIKNKEAK